MTFLGFWVAERKRSVSDTSILGRIGTQKISIWRIYRLMLSSLWLYKNLTRHAKQAILSLMSKKNGVRYLFTQTEPLCHQNCKKPKNNTTYSNKWCSCHQSNWTGRSKGTSSRSAWTKEPQPCTPHLTIRETTKSHYKSRLSQRSSRKIPP